MDADASTIDPARFDDLDLVRTTRIFVFHDRVIVANGLHSVIQTGPRAMDTTCFNDGFALTDAYGQSPADIVLIGYRQGSGAAAEATALLLGLFPAAPVVAFGALDDARLLVGAVTQGARGFLLWSLSDPPADLVVPPLVGGFVPDPAGGRAGQLTPREQQVLMRIAEGWTNLEIGRALELSEDTVKTTTRRIFRKLGARDRAHAVALGMRLNQVV